MNSAAPSYTTPTERLDNLMREVVARRRLKGPAMAEFKRLLIASGDTAAMAELVPWMQAAGELYERICHEARLPRIVRNDIRGNGQPNHGYHHHSAGVADPAVRSPYAVSGAKGRVSQAERHAAQDAVAASAGRSLLRSFMVNGQPIGDVTVGEARAWTKSQTRNVRFVLLLIDGLDDGVVIGQARTEAEAEAAYGAASK